MFGTKDWVVLIAELYYVCLDIHLFIRGLFKDQHITNNFDMGNLKNKVHVID